MSATTHGSGRPRRAWRGLRRLLLAGALGCLAAAPAAGRELQVPSPAHPTLATALQAAAPGDVLLIAPGTYRERLQVRKAVTLRPARPDGTVAIDGGGTGRVLEIYAAGVTVQELTVRNSGDTISTTDACVYVHEQAANVAIRNNRIVDCAFGIWINGSSGSRIAGNYIEGRPHRILSDRGNGINLWQIRSGVIEGNRIRQVRDGVYITVSSGSVVRGNRMRDLRFGIHYMYADGNRVVNNRTCNSRVGYALMFSKRLEVRGNIADGNATHGILFRSLFDSTIEDNVVVRNDKGLFINDFGFNVVRGNLVARNAVGVHVTGGADDNTVAGNDFVANETQVYYNQRVSLPWGSKAAGNYWSDYLGWDLDRDGRGEPAYHASDRMDLLVIRYPVLRLLAHSPVVRLLQALEERFPVLRPASIVEQHPAMAPHKGAGMALPGSERDLCGAFQPPAPAEARHMASR